MGGWVLGSRVKGQGSRFKVQSSKFKVQGFLCPSVVLAEERGGFRVLHVVSDCFRLIQIVSDCLILPACLFKAHARQAGRSESIWDTYDDLILLAFGICLVGKQNRQALKQFSTVSSLMNQILSKTELLSLVILFVVIRVVNPFHKHFEVVYFGGECFL